jgi:hypothetical protein
MSPDHGSMLPLCSLATRHPPLLLLRSPLLGMDLEAALLAAGRRVILCEVAELSLDFLRDHLAKGAGGFLSVNHAPEVAFLCREAGLPYVSWTVDPLPLSRWTFVEGGRTTLFVHRKALVEPLLRLGHPRVEWLPLAAPSRRWTESVQSAGIPPPSFVGSSLQDERTIFLSRLEGWGLGSAVEVLIPFLDSISAMAEENRDFRGFLVHPQTLPATLVQALDGRVDPMDIAEAMDAGLAWRYRRMQVSHLVTLGVDVYGDSGWENVVGLRWKGNLRNGDDMTRTYRDSPLSMDVPRLHQREIATLRAFDVLASGGLLVAEAGTELEDLFKPGEEFLAWTSPQERDEWIRSVLAGRTTEMDRIARAGREAAWNHRLDLRVGKILDAFEEFC